tara:strand:+ start:4443 stop:8090 length:3648 start_codon:yes stop_codon:yes gene_type:complete
MAEGELRIVSTSVVRTTEAVDALIASYMRLAAAQGRVDTSTTQSNTTQSQSAQGQTSVQRAIERTNAARVRANALVELERSGLSRNSEAYANLRGTILATEQASRGKVQVDLEEFTALERNTQAIERSAAQKRSLIEQTRTETQATASNSAEVQRNATVVDRGTAATRRAAEILELETRVLDRNSNEYAEARGAILAREQASRRGISTDTDTFRQLQRNSIALERTAAQTRALRLEQQRTAGATGTFAERMRLATQQVQLIDGPLGGIASRMTALTGIINSGAIGLAGFGIAAGLAFQQIFRGSQIAADTEVALVTLQAQVRATGFAAGFTASQLDDMARSFARNTLDSVEGVREIQNALLVFRSVAGDAFTEAIALSQDFAVANNRNARNIARTLGRALQDPLANYRSLRDLGIEINREDLIRIRSARQQNDLFGEQQVLLDRVRGSLGRVAEAQADTLRGDQDGLNQSYERFIELLGRDTLEAQRNVTQGTTSFFDFFTSGFERQTRQAANFVDILSEQNDGIGVVTDSLEIFEGQLRDIEAQQARVREQGIRFGGAAQLDELSDQARGIQLLIDRVTEYRDLLNAQAASPTGTIRTPVELDAIENLERQIRQQRTLTAAFAETGNTRSQEFRNAQAAIQSETMATQSNSDVAGIAAQEYTRLLIVLSDLSEQRARDNAIVQQTRSIENQIRNIGVQTELLGLQSTGLAANSEEYIRRNVVLRTQNRLISSNIDLESDQGRQLIEQANAVADLTVEMTRQAALQGQLNTLASRQTDNQQQLQILNLTQSGLRNTSEQYQIQLALIQARTAAIRGGFSDDEARVEVLNAEARALGVSNAALLQRNALTAAGVTGSSGNGFSFERPEDQQQNELVDLSETIRNIPEGEITELARQNALTYINGLSTELQNSQLNPLGLIIDNDGLIARIESEQGIIIARNQTLADLDIQARELGLIREDESILQAEERRLLQNESEIAGLTAFLETRNQIILDADEESASASISAFERTESSRNRIRLAGLADEISTGASSLANLRSNSTAAARIARAAALFSASVSFAQGIAKANETTGDPLTRAIAYAQALTQGATVLQTAQALNNPSFAFGGVDIQGAGTGRSDSIQANIARGESVITAPATARFREDLQRMNSGLEPRGQSSGTGGNSFSIIVQGDASERTVGLIESSLRDFETRVRDISSDVSLQTIQQENEVGGILDPI